MQYAIEGLSTSELRAIERLIAGNFHQPNSCPVITGEVVKKAELAVDNTARGPKLCFDATIEFPDDMTDDQIAEAKKRIDQCVAEKQTWM